jgi:putative transposase
MSRHRRSIRLKDYDYTQSGAYFVTICAHERACLFGAAVDGVMILNEWGVIVQEEWEQTAILRPNVELDAFVVMPNHIHGIIVITDVGARDNEARDNGARCIAPLQSAAPTRQFGPLTAQSLSTIVGTFKAAVTRRVNRQHDNTAPIWQRNYYEHIIRSEARLDQIRQYVAINATKWAEDSLYAE